MSAIHRLIDAILQVVTIALMLGLAVLVVAAVLFRYTGNSLIFYDELASVMLAWLTYYGAALAAARRAHLGLGAGVKAMPAGAKVVAFVVSELLVLGFFSIVAWYGWHVLAFMAGEALISLPWLKLQLVQSVIPVGAVLFILAQLTSLPEAWRDLLDGRTVEQREIDEALAQQAKQP